MNKQPIPENVSAKSLELVQCYCNCDLGALDCINLI